MNKDDEHLQVLSIAHYVAGVIAGLCSLFPLIHLFLGLAMVFAPEKLNTQGDMAPALVGWFFIVFAAVIILIGFTFSALIIATGRFLAQRRRYMFCLVMAGVECMFVPVGTVLGIFTILVLNRESVKMAFGRPSVD